MRGPRTRAVAAALLVCATLIPPAARAQLAAVRGTFIDPSGVDPLRDVDPRGMTSLRPTRRRTPTGFLYPFPPEPWRGVDLGGGWLGAGSIAAGGLFESGDTDETRFGRYTDWDDGLWLRWLDARFVQPTAGWYARFAAGDVAREDAVYRGELGKPGVFRLRAGWSGIPVPYANDAQLIFLGAGSDRLTLRPPLVVGGNTTPALDAALASAGMRVLSVQRDETRVELDLRPREGLRVFARYGQDERNGDRPFGGSLGFPAGTAAAYVETVEPIHQQTRRASLGLEWSGPRIQANGSYEVSLFRNREDALRFDVPLAARDPDIRQGRFALAPDSVWQDVRGDLAVTLPWNSRFISTVSWSRAQQNDDLVPPTVNSGRVGAGSIGTIDLDLWNQPASLAQRHADASIDTLLVDAALQSTPWKPLRLGAHVRVLDQDDDTRYTAENPLADEIGYIGEDGALEAQTPLRRVVAGRPSIEDFRFRSIPTSYQTRLGELTADWRVLGKTRLDASLGHEEVRREYREREETRDNRARVSLAVRDLEPVTVRLSAELSRRSGSSYDADPFAAYFASSLPGYVAAPGPVTPYTLDSLRMHDLANRNRQRAELRVNWLLREDMDAALSAGWRNDDFGADYGLTRQRSFNAGAEWSWQISPNASIYAYYGFEQRDRAMTTINDSGVRSSDGNAGGALFPLANRWSLDANENSNAAGAGFHVRPHPRITIDVAYTFLDTSAVLDYDYASAGALGSGLTTAGAGERFPTLSLRDNTVESQLRISLTEHLEVGALYRYQSSRIADFHQTGLEPLSDPGSIFLGHVDRDYSAQLFGAWLRVSY